MTTNVVEHVMVVDVILLCSPIFISLSHREPTIAALGSLMMEYTSIPAILAAFDVIVRCTILKSDGTVMTQCVTIRPSPSDSSTRPEST